MMFRVYNYMYMKKEIRSYKLQQKHVNQMQKMLEYCK